MDKIIEQFPKWQGKSHTTLKDLTGQTFGELTVLYRYFENTPQGLARWVCQCSCGTIVVRNGSSLSARKHPNCGCKNYVNLLGYKTGLLTVIEKTDKRKNGHIVWKCRCECGGVIEIASHHLTDKKNPALSCGCVNSRGEQLVKKALSNLNLLYQSQYTFADLKSDSDRVLYFDFGILNKDNQLIALIEYDGEQHYRVDNNGWNTDTNFSKLKLHDQRKDEYCKSHNIPLLRISYLYKDIKFIEMRIQKFLKEAAII